MITTERRGSYESLLKEYYRDHFTLEKLFTIIERQYFEKREFAYRPVEEPDVLFRNLSFESPELFHEFLIEYTPAEVYIGAVYEKGPSLKNPITELKWMGKELTFDIDMNDYDKERRYICSCQGKYEHCEKCWELINTAVYIIDETLRDDFGFEEIRYLFSGRRGVHIWVKDAGVLFLNKEIRRTIMDHITGLLQSLKKKNVSPQEIRSSELYYRVEEWTLKAFMKYLSVPLLVRIGCSVQKARKIYTEISNLPEGRNTVMRYLSQEVSQSQLFEIMSYFYPRIDKPVTIDCKRLLRLPFSIHGQTGKIVESTY